MKGWPVSAPDLAPLPVRREFRPLVRGALRRGARRRPSVRSV